MDIMYNWLRFRIVHPMIKFFEKSNAKDESYNSYANAHQDYMVEAKEFIETLWVKTMLYLDNDVRARATEQFHQVFWEMYLCAALLEVGLQVIPRTLRKCQNKGPDIQIGHGKNSDKIVWCEAIAVTAGTGPDAVRKSEPGKVSRVPHDAIKLRLTSALGEKRDKFSKYVLKEDVSADEPCIVAINAALVPSARKELNVPRIVASVFPFGWPTVQVNIENNTITGSGYTHQSKVAKASGASVQTDTFLSDTCTGVSAILYSHADPLNRPPCTGADLVLVHNPNSKAPLARGLIIRGQEYWMEKGELRHTDHNANDQSI